MAVFLTIIAGVITYTIGQIILKIFIEPIQDYKTIISEIAVALVNYANIYTNPGMGSDKIMDIASHELRVLASKLNAQTNVIPMYGLIAKLFVLPKREDSYHVQSNLIGLSNGIRAKNTGPVNVSEINAGKANQICKLLKIDMPR